MFQGAIMEAFPLRTFMSLAALCARRLPVKYPDPNLLRKEVMDTDLTDYSARFLMYLKREAPDLSRAIQPARDKEGRLTGSLLAKIEAPNRHVAAPLSIATENDEVTIGFDAYHTHLENWDSSESEESWFAKAISLVRDIMADRVLIASWWLDEKWCGSQAIRSGVDPKRPAYVDTKATLRLRSWTGQKDHG